MDHKARADALHAENIMLRADKGRLHHELTWLLEISRDEALDLREEIISLNEMLLERRKQAYAKSSVIASKGWTKLTDMHLVSRNEWLPCSRGQYNRPFGSMISRLIQT